MDDKVDIVQNAIDLAHAKGIAEVRVAILSAMETVNAKIAVPDPEAAFVDVENEHAVKKLADRYGVSHLCQRLRRGAPS